MNKTQLVSRVAEITGLSNAAAGQSLDAVIQGVTESLKKSESVAITGFGTFVTKDRAARMGRNPQTGEPMEIKAARVPGFKAGKVLKDAVR